MVGNTQDAAVYRMLNKRCLNIWSHFRKNSSAITKWTNRLGFELKQKSILEKGIKRGGGGSKRERDREQKQIHHCSGVMQPSLGAQCLPRVL